MSTETKKEVSPEVQAWVEKQKQQQAREEALRKVKEQQQINVNKNQRS